MGNLDQLHVRVDIDENDAWRFRPGGRAIAYLRGNLDFVRGDAAARARRR